MNWTLRYAAHLGFRSLDAPQRDKAFMWIDQN